MKGCETGEGTFAPGPEKGYLDFDDDECLAFSGWVENLEWTANDIHFRGYKVSDVPRRKPSPWRYFLWHPATSELSD